RNVRPRNRLGARRQHLPAARAQLRARLPAGRTRRRARRRHPRPDAADGQQPYHAELRRNHRRRRRQSRRQHSRRAAHRRGGRDHDDLLSGRERSGDLSHHADRARDKAARPAGPGRAVRMIRRHGLEILLWIALATVPLWLTLVGGYAALGSKILVYGIAALALNLVLGFTGGLSFGQAAYFGLGAYGAGMTLRYIAPSTPLAIVVGTLVGGLAATLLGPLVMRRRGIYFAMITIAIGQLLYFAIVRWNDVTGGEDGLSGFSRQDIHLGGLAIPLNSTNFYYLVLLCFTIAVAIMWTLLQS